MLLLVLGLLIFLGFHSLHALAPSTRDGLVARFGANGWRLISSAGSVLGVIVIILGYRSAPVINVWFPPAGMAHLSVTLMLFATICLVASFFPAGHIATKTKHPMVLSAKIWALAHLLANGDLRSILLFGSILAWGVMVRISLKRRERAGLAVPKVFVAAKYDFYVVLTAILAWAAITFKLHLWVFGVAPIVMG